VVAEGDDKNVLTMKQIYERILSRRAGLGEDELAA
jgi:hypothetical protein